MLVIELCGKPIPLQRPRFCRTKNNVVTFDAQKEEKEKCRWQIKSQFRNNPLKIPISLTIKFFMPIPKATSQVRKREMISNIQHHMKKPDIDNLAKFTLDCLNGILFEDDSQVWQLSVEKIYAEKPGTFISVNPYCHQKKE